MTHYEKPYIIAEAGCNHKGDMEIAKELINVAAMFCHADAIKFQKRCPKELLTPERTTHRIQTLVMPTVTPMVPIGSF